MGYEYFISRRYNWWSTLLNRQGMVRKLIIKMKNEKTAGPSGLLSEMMKAAGETRVDLVNQIIVEVDIPTE